VTKIDENQGLGWDNVDWVDKFNYLVENDLPTDDLRVSAYKNTLNLIEIGGYFVGNKDGFNTIRNRITTVYHDNLSSVLGFENQYNSQVSVMKGDSLEVAGILQKSGLNPAVLNVINPRNPGGGVTVGMQGHEEELFIRTNISSSLYMFSDQRKLYGIDKHESNYKYPLLNDKHGIYSRDVLVIKGNIETGYKLLIEPYYLSVVSVPLIIRPKLEFAEGKYLLAEPFLSKVKERIKTALRIALVEKHDCLVLNGFGSTATKYPPQHIAKIFNEILFDNEFYGKFKSVVFVIIDNPKIREEYNPSGDFMPFFDEFM
jgi:uncharacterized protein (TIGR02452 family)